MTIVEQEHQRLSMQSQLDGEKNLTERNQLGQFATPPSLALAMLKYGVELLGNTPPRFLDPAFGTGSFFSALLQTVSPKKIQEATGYEVDDLYGKPAIELWKNTGLNLNLDDFTTAKEPLSEKEKFNLVICNPPYVRHHHMSSTDKKRLQLTVQEKCGIHISGLAGLYCYFLCIAHTWMQKNGVAGWLIPSEFMDVNYGKAMKDYLTTKVTLLHIHRFDPMEVQFDDALVSSALVWFRNTPPPQNHNVKFTFGGSLYEPKQTQKVGINQIANNNKWTHLYAPVKHKEHVLCQLSDLFTVKRGVATGDNKFFILSREEIQKRNLPFEVFRPIIPSPRYVFDSEIKADSDGIPILDKQLFLLDCKLTEEQVEKQYPELWSYLETGKEAVANRYLCRNRKVWYFQEHRDPPPIICTYLGRKDNKGGRPFRFILNHSIAITANVYLLMYPKPVLEYALKKDDTLLRRIWIALNNLPSESLLEEGRVYGGGLHKLEPKELARVDATKIADLLNGVKIKQSQQIELFNIG